MIPQLTQKPRATNASLLQRLRPHWHAFWFTPTSPGALGFCRLFFFCFLFHFYLPRDFSYLGDIPAPFWMPTFFFDLFHIPLLPPPALLSLQRLFKLAL